MSNFNKLITNKPVSLTEQEVANLSETLSAVRTAGGGGGGQTKTYIGDGTNISINQDTGVVRLTPVAEASLYRDIPSAISSFSDANQYAKKVDYFNKNDINEMMLNKQDKLLFGYDEDNAISSINGSALVGTGGVTGDYYSASNPSGFINSDQAEAQIIAKKYITSSVSELDNFYSKSQTSGANEIANAIKDFVTEDLLRATSGELENWVSTNYYDKTETSSKEALETAFGSKQDNLTQEQLSAISSVSSIKGTILTGDSNIRTTSAEFGTNILWTLELTAQPVVTDTTLSGYDGIVATKDSTLSSQWNVGIAQAYKEQIETVSSKLTKTDADTLYAPISVAGDVNTLKSSSGNWDKVSDKLDTTAFSNVSGNFLTAHQSLDDYYTKTQVDNTFASATQLNNYLTTAKYGTDSATFALKTEIPTTVSQLTDSGNYYQKTETSSKTEITNALKTKLDSTAAAQTYQTKGDYVKNTDISLDANNKITAISGKELIITAHQSLTNYYTKSETSGANELSTEFGKYALKSEIPTVPTKVSDLTDSANYYQKTETSSKSELSTEFAKYVTTALLDTVSSTLNDDIEDVSGLVGNKVDKPSQSQTGKLVYDSDTSAWSDIGLDDYVPYSATNLAIGSEVVASAYSFAQGWDNSANWNSVTFGTHSTAYSRSLALGENAVAYSHSLSIGGGANSLGNSADSQSIAVGNGVSARYRSIAVGSHSTVADTNALSIGAYCVASGTGSVAIGYQNSAYNVMFTGGGEAGGQAFGGGLEISGGLAIGYYNATKDAAFVIGDGTESTRSDSFVIYRDGSVSAKGDISANGVKLGGGGGGFTGASAGNGLSGNGLTSSPLGLHSSATKTISAVKYEEINTNMLAQKLLVVTSDQQIIDYVMGGGANNEGCIFFVTSAH